MESAIDIIATMLFVYIPVDLCWISVWNLMDNIFLNVTVYFHPAIIWFACYVISTSICLSMLTFQESALEFFRNINFRHAFIKIIVQDVYLLLVCFTSVLYWRSVYGIYTFLAKYFPILHKGKVDLSVVHSHIASYLMLCLLFITSSVITRGCYITRIDDEASDNRFQSIFFRYKYFGTLYDYDSRDTVIFQEGVEKECSIPKGTNGLALIMSEKKQET